MIDQSDHVAEKIFGFAPCSVELAAGCGKTELIARISEWLYLSGKTALILTHTNAGVDVIRRRLQKLNVPLASMTVLTIDSWCFNLIRHRPIVSKLEAPDVPIWEDRRLYYAAACLAMESSHVRQMLADSYDLLVVDEYQDCIVEQHAAIVKLSEVLRTIVLGDPLQGLFNFGDNVPVSWTDNVLVHFPAIGMSPKPWRWLNTNPALGDWILSIRKLLLRDESINLAGAPVHWIQRTGQGSVIQACRMNLTADGSVVALGRFRHDIIPVARSLSGDYLVMEEVEGKVLLAFADVVDEGDNPTIARATVQFAIDCATGVASLFNAGHRDRLGSGRPLHVGRRLHLKRQLLAVNALLEDCSAASVRDALGALAELPDFTLYCSEAWVDVMGALELSAIDPDLTFRDAVVLVRDRIRWADRRSEQRIISRPLLVKGLEYDHVVILDADAYNSRELYVALSRARKSVTVLCANVVVRPK